MRSIKILALAAVLALGGLFTANRAEALPAQGAPAIGIAVNENTLLQDVAYVCRRVRRCGPNGCIWRRVCRWRGPRAYPYYYGPYWRGYYRPYWRPYRYWGRPYWRGRRYWRRW
jgi:hypothetical protein